MPAAVECGGGQRRRGDVRGVDADDGAVGKPAVPRVVADAPVIAPDMIQRGGNVGAVLPVAELADLLRTLLEGPVVTTGQKKRKEEKNCGLRNADWNECRLRRAMRRVRERKNWTTDYTNDTNAWNLPSVKIVV